MRVKLVFDYGLPDYDPEKHDPDKTFAFLVYRGVSYAKWVNLKKHFGTSFLESYVLNVRGFTTLFFCANI